MSSVNATDFFLRELFVCVSVTSLQLKFYIRRKLKRRKQKRSRLCRMRKEGGKMKRRWKIRCEVFEPWLLILNHLEECQREKEKEERALKKFHPHSLWRLRRNTFTGNVFKLRNRGRSRQHWLIAEYFPTKYLWTVRSRRDLFLGQRNLSEMISPVFRFFSRKMKMNLFISFFLILSVQQISSYDLV